MVSAPEGLRWLYPFCIFQVYQVRSSLEDALRRWDAYEHHLTKVTRDLTETEYALNQHQVATGDVAQFADQLDQLKVMFWWQGSILVMNFLRKYENMFASSTIYQHWEGADNWNLGS